MSVVKLKPSLVVNYQAPEFIRSDYAKFITFLQKYYEYLQQSDKALSVLRNIETFNDIDEQTDDAILSVMYSLFLPDFPQILAADKRMVLKHISEFYTSKGSIDSIKTFFRIVYGEETEVYLPKVDILKLNAGSWRKLFKIKITGLSAGTVYKLLGQEIYQVDAVTGNKTVKATVIDYEEVTGSIVITADNIVLNFDSTLTTYSTRNDTGDQVTFTVVNQLASSTISYGGLNYKAGNTVKLDNGVSNTENIVVNNVSYGTIKNLILNTAGDNYSTSDEITFDDHYVFDGSNASAVSLANNTINLLSHSLSTGDIVKYRIEPDTTYAQTAIGGIIDEAYYYVIKVDTSYIKLATTKENATNGVEVDLTSLGTGTKHYIVYELPNVVKAKAKISNVASEELFSENFDSLGDYFTITEEEDRFLLEDGSTIRQEYGEQAVFKSVAKGKYVTDLDDNGTTPGSITSPEFEFLLESQNNDTSTYVRSSYVKSNGLIRQLLPAHSDVYDNYSLDWAANKGLNVVLTDEELRVGFAYDNDYAAAGNVTPTYPLTFIVEFQSNEDYNNLEYYELSKNWGNTAYPTVKPITSWNYDSAVEFEDFHDFSELQHYGIYPESASTFSYGETRVSQRGFDPVNKPILVIREVRTQADSSISGTQRPWEYRFVFREGTKANLKIYVNSQPIQIKNQLLTCETTTGGQTIVNEDGTFLIQEVYSTIDPLQTIPSGVLVGETYSIINATGVGSVFKYLDKVKATQLGDPIDDVFNVIPNRKSTPSGTNRILNDAIFVLAQDQLNQTIATLYDESNVVTFWWRASNAWETSIGPSAFTTTISAAPSNVPWAGIATNGAGTVLVVQKSENSVFGVSALYTPTNRAYYTNLADATTITGWAEIKLPFSAVWGHVSYGNGKWVIIEGTGNPMIEPKEKFLSGGRILTSTDLVTWTVTTVRDSDCWTNLKFLNGEFWALPYGTTQSLVTNITNGEVFEGDRISLSAPAGAVFTRVLFASYGLPTGTAGNYSIGAAHSPNSVDVVASIFLGKNTATINANNTTFGNDPIPGTGKRLYITLEYSYVQTLDAIRSVDGLNWNLTRLPIDKVSDMAYGNGVYVATTFNNDGRYIYSYDSINWKQGRLPLQDTELNNMQTTGNAFWNTITYGADKFIATVANDPSNNTNSRLHTYVAVSSDGVNWELQNNIETSVGALGNFVYNMSLFTGSKGSIVKTIYSDYIGQYYFIGQGVTFTPSTSSSTTTDLGRGFALGGLTPANSNEIDGIDFATEAQVNPVAGLATSRYAICGMHSTTVGYGYAGWISGGSRNDEIDGIRFSDQTLYNPAAVAATAGGHQAQGAMYNKIRGYQIGGHFSPDNIGYTQRFVFSTETSANLTSLLKLPLPLGTHAAACVTSDTKAYTMGGYNYPATYVTEIDGIDMTSETTINPAATLSQARHWPGSLMSTTRGYALGGFIGPAPGYSNEIDGIEFATETFINPAATLTGITASPASMQNSQGTAGYLSGGYNGGPINTNGKFTFSTETYANIASVAATSRYHHTGVSQGSTTNSYTWVNSYSRSIDGALADIILMSTGEQLTKDKTYYVVGSSGNNLSLALTKENAIALRTVNVQRNTIANYAANISLITDRISAGNQDSFTKATKDAQFTIYAMKRSIGSRDGGIKYHSNPLIGTYEDIEKLKVNYTSDNKYYIYEKIRENVDYILAERSELFATDQVNLELEIDKRSKLESENYTTYPYFVLENSAVDNADNINDINIPDYSKVRVFVDKDVIQSANNTNRQTSVRSFNDYGMFGATAEFTTLDNEKQSYNNLQNPVLSDNASAITYRNNYNVLVEGYDNTPYVNGVIPTQTEYSSGPGEFGNTGIVSFVNSEIRTNSTATNLENNFYDVAISNQQGYYDNDVRKPAIDRMYHTLSFNVPKELGDKFDTPFDRSIRNIIDNTSKNPSFKDVDYSDVLFLDAPIKNNVNVFSYRRKPIDWMPIFGGNATFVDSYSQELKVSGFNFVGQTWPSVRDPISKNVQNGFKILIAPGLTAWSEYQNLPDYLLGLQTTNSINDSDSTGFYFSNPTRVYLLRDPSWNAVDLTGFTLVEAGKNYLTATSNVSVYSRDFAAGGPYTLDNNSAMYIFGPLTIGTNPSYGFSKRSGTSAWDSQVYSSRGFFRDCYVKGQVNQTSANPDLMFGLNSDPTTNASYDTLDFSWYFDGGIARIYENGSFIGNYGTYTPQTVFEIYYDGSNVYYTKDNQVQRIVPRGVGSMLYFDSSFYTPYSPSAVNAGSYIAFQNLEFGVLERNDIYVNDPAAANVTYDGISILLEDGSTVIGTEKNRFGYNTPNGNYSNSVSTIAIEFYNPYMASTVAQLGLLPSNSQYHFVLYCDKADYLNVSTDTQKTTYTFFNCWSPTGSNFLKTAADDFKDYVITIRDLTKTDYIVKRKHDALNKQANSATDARFMDAWIVKGEDDYGKYLKFYSSYANAIAGTSPLSLSSLGIGSSTLTDYSETSGDLITTPSGKNAYNYYGTINETDVLLTYSFDPRTDVVSNTIVLPRHGLSVGDSVKFRKGFEGLGPSPLVDNQTYYVQATPTVSSIRLATTIGGSALTLTQAATSGKRAYLQVLPRTLDFGATQFMLNTKTRYTVNGSSLLPYALGSERAANIINNKQYILQGRTDVQQLSKTGNVFSDKVEFTTGDYVEISLGAGDRIVDADGNQTLGPATVYAYAIAHSDNIISFVKSYEEAINNVSFLTGYYNNFSSIFTNTVFRSTDSYVASNVFNMPANQKHNMSAGQKLRVYSSGVSLNNATTYYVASTNLTDTAFSITTNANATGVTTVASTSYNNLVTIHIQPSSSKQVNSPMNTGTIREDVMISYTPYHGRETGTIQNILLQTPGSYNRIPVPKIIPLEGRAGSGAEIYPMVNAIGAVRDVEFIDGGTHSVNRTMYLPYSFFSSSITGNWAIGETVLKSSTVVGTLTDVNGRYFVIQQNGAGVTVTYGDTLTGQSSGATAVVGRNISISGVSSGTLATVTTSTVHYLNTGDRIYISGINSVIPTGTYYASVKTPTTFYLYSDSGLSTPVARSATYTSGGTIATGLYTATGTAIPGEVTLSSANGPTTNYDNDKNLLLTTSKLQDSYYYQDYSYAVRSGTSYDNWKQYFNKLVHPAGIAVFGEINYNTPSSGQVLLGNTVIDNNGKINNTKTATSTTVTIT